MRYGIEFDEHGNIHHSFCMPEQCPDVTGAVETKTVVDLDRFFYDMEEKSVKKRVEWEPGIDGGKKILKLKDLPTGTIVLADGYPVDTADPAADAVMQDGIEIEIIAPGKRKIVYNKDGSKQWK